MVEGQWGQVFEGEPSCFGGIVLPFYFGKGYYGKECHSDGAASWVTVYGTETFHFFKLAWGIQPGLFFQLPSGTFFKGLVHL